MAGTASRQPPGAEHAATRKAGNTFVAAALQLSITALTLVVLLSLARAVQAASDSAPVSAPDNASGKKLSKIEYNALMAILREAVAYNPKVGDNGSQDNREALEGKALEGSDEARAALIAAQGYGTSAPEGIAQVPEAVATQGEATESASIDSAAAAAAAAAKRTPEGSGLSAPGAGKASGNQGRKIEEPPLGAEEAKDAAIKASGNATQPDPYAGAVSGWMFPDPCMWAGPILVVCKETPSRRTVQRLELVSPFFLGRLSPRIHELPYLTELVLRNSSFSVSPMPLVNTLHTLTFLEMGFLDLSIERNHSFSGLTNLRTLLIYDSGLRGTLESLGLDQISNLHSLGMGGNRVEGGLPTSLSTLSSVTEINLGSNRLTGEVPAEFLNKPLLQILDLSHNELSGELPDNFDRVPKLSDLLIGNNNFSGSLPKSMATLRSLKNIAASNNMFSGPLPELFMNVSTREKTVYLLIANNSFSGPIPQSIALALKKTPAYFILDITNNNFSGPVPPAFVEESISIIGFLSNPDLCGAEGLPECLYPPPPPSPGATGIDGSVNLVTNGSSVGTEAQGQTGLSAGAVAGIVAAVMLLFVVLLVAAFLLWQRKIWQKQREEAFAAGMKTAEKAYGANVVNGDSSFFSRSKTGGLDEKKEKTKAKRARMEGPYLFSLNELMAATNNFHPDSLLGRGGFGHVYKGTLKQHGSGDNIDVAVKVLAHHVAPPQVKEDSKRNQNDPSDVEKGGADGGEQGEKEFEAEVEFLSLVRHKNLVRLVGFCNEGSHRMLVYEFLPQGSLSSNLHENATCRPIPWSTRVRIANGVARGLSYLHEGCMPRIVHRDIKPSNILLDNSFEPKIADFGLARMVPDGVEVVSTKVQGTRGYVAPEYLKRERIGEKVDVYSYGVLLLELISGQSACGKVELPEWAMGLVRQKCLLEIADPVLHGDINETELRTIVHIALMCTKHSPSRRPYMSQVVQMLQGDIIPNAILALADASDGTEDNPLQEASQDENSRPRTPLESLASPSDTLIDVPNYGPTVGKRMQSSNFHVPAHNSLEEEDESMDLMPSGLLIPSTQ